VFTPRDKMMPSQCSFKRCRQWSTLFFHYEGERYEACAGHEAKAARLQEEESARKRANPHHSE